MKDAEIINILKIATAFRKAIEDCGGEELSKYHPAFNNFPRGCCGIVSNMLAKWLFECGFGWFDYVLGCREEHKHAWLQKDNIIVDITADQFDDMKDKKVIVTTDLLWHASFNPIKKHSANPENMQGLGVLIASTACEIIIKTMRATNI